MTEMGGDVVSWAVELQGEQHDRDATVRMFASGEPRVAHEVDPVIGSVTLLYSKRFDSLTKSTEVMDVARLLVAEMNGAMSVLSRTEPLRPGRILPLFRDGSRGKPIGLASGHVKAGPATLTATGVVIGPDGVRRQSDQRSEAQKWLELAQTDDHVADALRFLSGRVTWFELWKAFEEVQESLGGRQFIWRDDVKWSTRDETNRFTMTAQHFRHANTPLPPNPMTFDEALNWLRYIIERWIKWRRSQST